MAQLSVGAFVSLILVGLFGGIILVVCILEAWRKCTYREGRGTGPYLGFSGRWQSMTEMDSRSGSGRSGASLEEGGYDHPPAGDWGGSVSDGDRDVARTLVGRRHTL
ncbi:hypothetical protein EG329_011143 [Mollisiaceae sp. DMI_Dod_QoI]|nr:hypothetical protein EG329_011143 [Helotiales sp. DMI_Dod_QoI]